MKASIPLLLSACLFVVTPPAWAGGFDDAAGRAGSRAIAIDDPRIRSWAETVAFYRPGEDLDELWQAPGQALGPASGDALAVTGLGRGGSITFFWELPLLNGPGPDFAVFENSFSDRFLELAHVEVSSDGEHWQRFPSISQTPSAVGPFGLMDPTDLSGFAGKYRATFGTGFDFSDLPPHPPVDRQAIRFIRLIDVVGDGRESDSLGNPIYDPFPTFGSAGFDLDGLAILAPPPLTFLGATVGENTVTFRWTTEPGKSYRLEKSTVLSPGQWQLVSKVTPEFRSFNYEAMTSSRSFFRLQEAGDSSD